MIIAGRIKTIIRLLLIVSLFIPQAFSGTLDPTFGTGGKLTTDFPFTSSSSYDSYGYSVFRQPSGRLVGMGSHRQPGPDGLAPGIAAVGLTSTGVVDTTYSGGKTLDWDPITSISLSDAKMLPDGRILRLSQYFGFTSQVVKLIRTNVDGSVDTAFAPDFSIGGIAPYLPYELAVLNDGRILVLLEHRNTSKLYLLKFNADGSRDTTFGANGEKELRLPYRQTAQQQEAFPFGMEILPNGKIVIAGGLNYSNNSSDFAGLYIARLDPNGNFDHSFGALGVVRRSFGQRIYPTDFLIQPDGKYLVSGLMTNTHRDSFMARFTQRGRLDGSFGSGGTVVTDFFTFGDDHINSVTLLSDGKIIAAGESALAPSPFSNFLVARYAANGTLEAHTFTAFTASANSGAYDVMIQPDEKILVIGYTKNPNTAVSGNVFAMARYTAITND